MLFSNTKINNRILNVVYSYKVINNVDFSERSFYEVPATYSQARVGNRDTRKCKGVFGEK